MSLRSQFMYVLDESMCQLLELVNDATLTVKSSEATGSILTVEGGLHGRCKGKGRNDRSESRLRDQTLEYGG
jgi:hypothetical protein